MLYLLLSTITVVTNLGFVAAFDTSTRQPSWVAYDLEPSEVIAARRAPMPFVADPRIPESDVAADYAHSGYDRGHMAPAADFNWSTNALRETYYFSNISPQTPILNRGRWREIEMEVRNLAKSGTVHVITAPLSFSTNRCGRLPVPTKFVKVIYGSFGFRLYIEDNVLEKREAEAEHCLPNSQTDDKEQERREGEAEASPHGC